MANRKIVQDQKFIYGWDNVGNTPVFSADHGATWNAIGGGGGAFQIIAGTGTAENIGDDRATPGNNTVSGAHDGQFNAGVETSAIKAPPHGTANNYATVGGGRDNYVDGEGSVVPGGQGNDVGGDDSIAWGRLNNVPTNLAGAGGREALTRNVTERAYAAGVYPEGQAQERVIILGREIFPGAGNAVPLYTDHLLAGTDEYLTVVGSTYQVAVMIQVNSDTGAGPLMAAWELRGAFKNVAGAVVQCGATTTTFICNDSPAIFDTAPTLAAVGTTIRVTGADDGTGVNPIRWFARMVTTEQPALPGIGA